MNAPGLDQLAQAVLAWQRRHPLAQRLDARAVHSIGLVALPFMKAPVELAPPSWHSLLKVLRTGHATAAGSPAFRKRFIEGIGVAAAARFAARHGVDAVEGADDWPQRRIEVDDDLAVRGGWPQERWLATAAIEAPQGRTRVLIGLAPQSGRIAVLGRRVWDRQRLMLAAALFAAIAVAGAVALRGDPAPAPDLRVVGALQPASAASAASAAAPAAHPASLPVAIASAPAVAAGTAASAASAAASIALAAPPALSASAEAPFDIRPRLGPVRQSARPPLGAGSAVAAPVEPSRTASAPASTAPVAMPSAPAAPSTSRPARIDGPVVALVSPPYAKRAEAEAMLQRMREHLTQTLPAGKVLEQEIFETPQGYRAALWPFASREEAQILNATMIARGWRTRAVDF